MWFQLSSRDHDMPTCRNSVLSSSHNTDTVFTCAWSVCYGVAMTSRLLKIIGFFCKRAPWKRLYPAKETCDLKEPTNRSQSIAPSAKIIHALSLTHTQPPTLSLSLSLSHTHTYMHTQAYMHAHAYMNTHTHAHTYTRTHTCKHIFIYIWYMHTNKHHTHTHMHTHVHTYIYILYYIYTQRDVTHLYALRASASSSISGLFLKNNQVPFTFFFFVQATWQALSIFFFLHMPWVFVEIHFDKDVSYLKETSVCYIWKRPEISMCHTWKRPET